MALSTQGTSVDAIHARSAQAARERDERERLQLQRMERALVRAWLSEQGILPRDDYECIRYAFGLARLHVFRPEGGAADVTVNGALVAPLRNWLLDHLHAGLRETPDLAERLAACQHAMPQVRARAIRLRRRLLEAHVNDFDAAALDREAGRRALVVVAGGGGGAGFVYVGAYARLMDAGLVPDYIVGNSMGAILSIFRAQRRHTRIEDYLDFARGLKNADVFSASRKRAEFCVPGLLHLHLRALHQRLRVGELRRPLRLDEMEIPLDLVVAGVRRRPYERLPSDIRQPDRGAGRWLPLSLRIAARFTRLLRYFNSDVVEPIALGRDSDTRAVHAVDAAGFSGAVPTILQYEPGPGAGVTREIFAELMHRKELVALIDGGVADNVPTRTAWRGVAEGRAGGTRNAYYLAFDCFRPKLDPKNVWLWPIMQTVQMQMRMNRVYADTLVRFDPTLSPLNIVPKAAALDLAVGWGYEQMEAQLPEVWEMLRPVTLARGSDTAARAS